MSRRAALKRRLLAPGPVEVPPEVLAAAARPVLHHRTAEFREMLLRVRRNLGRVACVGPDEALVLTGSGTAAFESTLLAAVPRGARVVVVEAGKFGERWAAMARRFGYDTVVLSFPWGRAAGSEELAALLERHPDTAAVLTTHSETSTGVLHDVRSLAEATRRVTPDALLLVDAVTSLAAAELRPREWGLDGVVSGSQKGLMTPPGLGIAWLSERAWGRAGDAVPSYYLDLRRERDRQARGETAFTPATSLVAGLDVALEMLLEEGIEAVWARRARLNEAILAGGEALGLRRYAERVSPAVAAMAVPEGVSAPDVVRALGERGIRISGGQEQAKEVLLRPSVLGHADRYDAITVVAALEEALRELGRSVPHGAGVAAAMRVLEAG